MTEPTKSRAKYHRFGGYVFIRHGDELEQGMEIPPDRKPHYKYLAPLPPKYHERAGKILGL